MTCSGGSSRRRHLGKIDHGARGFSTPSGNFNCRHSNEPAAAANPDPLNALGRTNS